MPKKSDSALRNLTSRMSIFLSCRHSPRSMPPGSAFAGSPIAIGGQNMHWENSGAWTGEISAPMLLEAGCRYVELAHSERLQHFGETYPFVRRKVEAAIRTGLTPIICLGETAQEKREGRTDEVLAEQVLTSLAGLPDVRVPDAILAYEPRWAIGAAEAASPDYVAARHEALRKYPAGATGSPRGRLHPDHLWWLGDAGEWQGNHPS